MGEGVSVATIEELERLWYELSRELIASGSVEKFTATVIDNNGDASEEEVVRIGNFNVVAEGEIFNLSKKEEERMKLSQDNQVDFLDGSYDIFMKTQVLFNLLLILQDLKEEPF